MRGRNLHAFWDFGWIKNLNEEVNVLTKRLISKGNAPNVTDLNVGHAAGEFCKIVGTPGSVTSASQGKTTSSDTPPVAEHRLTVAGARLAGLLKARFVKSCHCHLKDDSRMAVFGDELGEGSSDLGGCSKS